MGGDCDSRVTTVGFSSDAERDLVDAAAEFAVSVESGEGGRRTAGEGALGGGRVVMVVTWSEVVVEVGKERESWKCDEVKGCDLQH